MGHGSPASGAVAWPTTRVLWVRIWDVLGAGELPASLHADHGQHPAPNPLSGRALQENMRHPDPSEPIPTKHPLIWPANINYWILYNPSHDDVREADNDTEGRPHAGTVAYLQAHGWAGCPVLESVATVVSLPEEALDDRLCGVRLTGSDGQSVTLPYGGRLAGILSLHVLLDLVMPPGRHSLTYTAAVLEIPPALCGRELGPEALAAYIRLDRYWTHSHLTDARSSGPPAPGLVLLERGVRT